MRRYTLSLVQKITRCKKRRVKAAIPDMTANMLPDKLFEPKHVPDRQLFWFRGVELRGAT